MTAPTLEVHPDQTKRRCVVVVFADLGDEVTVWRVASTGTNAVRGASAHAMTGTVAFFADYELPQNVEVSYFVSSPLGVSASVSAGTFDFGGDVIFDLGNPAQGLQVIVESFPSQDYDIQQDTANVWDRSDPVVVSGERQLPSGTLNLITLTLSERSQLLAALRSGNIVAFSPWKPEYGVDSPAYYAMGKVTEARVIQLALEESRRWAIAVQQVAAPRSSYIYPSGGNDWQAIKDAGNWTTQLGNTWLEVIGL